MVQTADLRCGRLCMKSVRRYYVDFNICYERCVDPIRAICGELVTHPGCGETSMMLEIRPDLVDMSKAVKGPKDVWADDFPFPALQQAGCYTIPSRRQASGSTAMPPVLRLR